jgi:TRAP-type mannitol/chloroaromatic compound transport system permease small subunit
MAQDFLHEDKSRSAAVAHGDEAASRSPSASSARAEEVIYIPVQAMIRLSLRLRVFVEFVGRWGSLFILPLVFVTMWDVLWRKLRNVLADLFAYLDENVSSWFGSAWTWAEDVLFQTVPFQSTLLQELEWHFHTALFTLVLGYAYVNNRHVRVDLIREKLPLRRQAWIEFLGCSFFMIPYCLVVIYFAAFYAYDSFVMSEISASLVGLSQRWIIKTVLLLGLIVAALSGIAVWLQTVLVLFGPKDLRFNLMTLEWPEDQQAS